MSVFAKRLKEARKHAGLSQERLGVQAGIDEMSASARMNQYERGKHGPEAYFYAQDDELAEVVLAFHRMDRA